MPFTFDQARFQRFADRIVTEARTVTLEVAQEAAQAFGDQAEEVMKRTFIQAVTPTGLSGKPEGRRGPGREDTGTLVDAITKAVEQDGSNAFVGRAGWLQGQMYEYFLYQDQGTRTIAAAHGLESAFIAGKNAALEVILKRGFH